MRARDGRDEWRPDLLPDGRVRHYWDEGLWVGRWYATDVESFDGIVWDAYYLYDAGARWDEASPVAISSGATVIAERERLRTALLPLWIP